MNIKASITSPPEISPLKTRAFTLLEIVIVIAILAVAGSSMGFQIWKGLKVRRFQTTADRICVEMQTCRHLSLNTQTDWDLIFSLEKKGYLLFEQHCPELGRTQRFSLEAPYEMRWNHLPVNKVGLHFSATGKIYPAGILELIGPEQTVSWDLPTNFSMIEIDEKN